MKNLKKLLALMLVLVLALGMVPMVATASDDGFTDADDIEFIEAADILKEVGIIVGYTDGSYQPQQSVTRAEAVAYIVRMLLTPAVANRLPDNRSSFTDVLSNPSVSWAAGEIEYAFGEGIVFGRGEGLFDPQGNVTGIEMAAFLLRALGIGKYDNPATWAFNAVADGTRNGILTIDDDVDLSAPATRDQVGLYTFNSLIHSDPVTKVITSTTYMIVPGSNPTAGNTNIPLDVMFDEFDSRDDARVAATTGPKGKTGAIIGADYNIETVVRTREVTTFPDSLAETFFKLELHTGEEDEFGRPGFREWVYNNKVVSKAPTLEPVATYTAAVRNRVVYDALALRSGAEDVDVTRFLDGVKSTIAINNSTSAWLAGVSGTAAAANGNGLLTEVYRDADGNITIVQISTFVGAVEDITAATGTDKRSVTIGPASNNSNAPTAPATHRFETEGFALGDIVIYTAARVGDTNYVVQSVGLAKVETITPTRYVTNTNFVAGGRTYTYSHQAHNDDKIIANREAVVYFDSYDYVILTTGTTAAVGYNIAYVRTGTALNGAPDQWGEDVHRAEMIFNDGSVATKEIKNPEDAPTTNNVSSFVRQFVYFTPENDGTYTLDQTGMDNSKRPGTSAAPVALDLRNGVNAFTWDTNGNGTIDGDETFYGNDKTLYIIRVGNTITTYAGFADPSLPSIRQDAFGTVTTVGGVAVAVYIQVGNLAQVTTDFVFLTGATPTSVTIGSGADRETYYQTSVHFNGNIERSASGAITQNMLLDEDYRTESPVAPTLYVPTLIDEDLEVYQLAEMDPAAPGRAGRVSATGTMTFDGTSFNNGGTLRSLAAGARIFSFGDTINGGANTGALTQRTANWLRLDVEANPAATYKVWYYVNAAGNISHVWVSREA